MNRFSFHFRLAIPGEEKPVHELMTTVSQALQDESLYVCDTLDFVTQHISEHGFIVLAFARPLRSASPGTEDTSHFSLPLSAEPCGAVQDKSNEIDNSGLATLAGIMIIRFPGKDDDNLGRDAGIPPEEYDHVAHIESAAVLPEYRGYGLQGQMLRYAENILKSQSEKCISEMTMVKGQPLFRAIHYMFATVSPENPASWRTLELNGFHCLLEKEKYDGLLRRIYFKSLR